MFKHRLRMIGYVATRAFIALVVAVVVASGLAFAGGGSRRVVHAAIWDRATRRLGERHRLRHAGLICAAGAVALFSFVAALVVGWRVFGKEAVKFER